MTQQQVRHEDAADLRDALLRAEVAALRAEVEHLRGSEASLREAEDRYREIAEQSSDLISRHRADGVFMYASPAAMAILGYQPHELIGLAVHDLIHPDDWDAALATFNDARDAGAPHATVVCRLRRKDGHYVWVESTDRFVHDPVTGEVTLFHAVTRDISERKAAEDALRSSEERYRELAEQSKDMISRHASDITFN
jgi:PAS domain S-box-containing protein